MIRRHRRLVDAALAHPRNSVVINRIGLFPLRGEVLAQRIAKLTGLFINPAVVKMCARPSCRRLGAGCESDGLAVCPKGLRDSARFLEYEAKVAISLSVRTRLINRRLKQSNSVEVIPRLIGGLSLLH
jgi:hypothetical protein